MGPKSDLNVGRDESWWPKGPAEHWPGVCAQRPRPAARGRRCRGWRIGAGPARVVGPEDPRELGKRRGRGRGRGGAMVRSEDAVTAFPVPPCSPRASGRQSRCPFPRGNDTRHSGPHPNRYCRWAGPARRCGAQSPALRRREPAPHTPCGPALTPRLPGVLSPRPHLSVPVGSRPEQGLGTTKGASVPDRVDAAWPRHEVPKGQAAHPGADPRVSGWEGRSRGEGQADHHPSPASLFKSFGVAPLPPRSFPG